MKKLKLLFILFVTIVINTFWLFNYHKLTGCKAFITWLKEDIFINEMTAYTNTCVLIMIIIDIIILLIALKIYFKKEISIDIEIKNNDDRKICPYAKDCDIEPMSKRCPNNVICPFVYTIE